MMLKNIDASERKVVASLVISCVDPFNQYHFNNNIIIITIMELVFNHRCQYGVAPNCFTI